MSKKSTHRRIADDMAQAMNAANFCEEFNAVAIHWPDLSLEKMEGLYCHVRPAKETGERSSRASFAHEYTLEICLRQKHVGTTDADKEQELDELGALMEQILEFWKVRKPVETYGLKSFDMEEPVDVQRSQEQSVGMCLLTLTFMGHRPNL